MLTTAARLASPATDCDHCALRTWVQLCCWTHAAVLFDRFYGGDSRFTPSVCGITGLQHLVFIPHSLLNYAPLPRLRCRPSPRTRCWTYLIPPHLPQASAPHWDGRYCHHLFGWRRQLQPFLHSLVLQFAAFAYRYAALVQYSFRRHARPAPQRLRAPRTRWPSQQVTGRVYYLPFWPHRLRLGYICLTFLGSSPCRCTL